MHHDPSAGCAALAALGLHFSGPPLRRTLPAAERCSTALRRGGAAESQRRWPKRIGECGFLVDPNLLMLWWFTGILWWFTGILWWFTGILWWFTGILWWFSDGLMELYGGFSWDRSWDFMGFTRKLT